MLRLSVSVQLHPAVHVACSNAGNSSSSIGPVEGCNVCALACPAMNDAHIPWGRAGASPALHACLATHLQWLQAPQHEGATQANAPVRTALPKDLKDSRLQRGSEGLNGIPESAEEESAAANGKLGPSFASRSVAQPPVRHAHVAACCPPMHVNETCCCQHACIAWIALVIALNSLEWRAAVLACCSQLARTCAESLALHAGTS